MKRDIRERLLSKVDKSPGFGPGGSCWRWTGAVDSWGYGRIAFEGKNVTAHRLSYGLFSGPVKESGLILHKCDVAQCTNPEHLYIGNHLDNVKDAYRRNRYPSRAGISNGNSKLTESQVKEIRKLNPKNRDRILLAKRFGVCKATIAHILTKRTWRSINAQENTHAKSR